ncbi:MAG: c-type cytochrome biogenesis protein CcmI [Pseudomonadota bacterium]
MLFWIVSIALAFCVTGLMALALWRGRAQDAPPAAYDLRVYRDQLKEIDRDLARGVIQPADAERVRAEVSRRILAADARLQAPSGRDADRGPALMPLALCLALVLGGGAAFLYADLGSPGYPDLPRQLRLDQAEYVRATRPDQATAESDAPPVPAAPQDPQFEDLMDKLRATLAERPNDLQGHILLAQNEAASGDFTAAWAAQDAVIRIKGPEATGQDFAELGELMILAAGGYVSPEAERILGQALQLDRGNPIARYYWGLMMDQVGRPDIAFTVWDQLLAQSPASAPWRPILEERLPMLATLAGVTYRPRAAPQAPPALAGPSQDDLDAASDMSVADQMDMARGMVAGLEARLSEDGGSPDEWARLITSLSVLGEPDRANAALAQASAAYADDPAALTLIASAAAQAGVAQ